MERRPVNESEQLSYPRQQIRGSKIRTSRFASLRKFATAAAGAAVIFVAGCDWENPFNPRLSGDIAPTSDFVCGAEKPESIPTIENESWVYGELCGSDSSAWVALDVEASRRVWITLNWSPTNVMIDITDPSGALLGQLDPETTSIELDLTPGRWIFEASAIDAEASAWEGFELSVETL